MLARIRSSLAELEVNPKYQYILIGLVTLFAMLLRLYKLGEWSFWIDEIYTIERAQTHYGSLEATIRNIPPIRNWIPLSVILTSGTLNVLGTSEWSARLVAAIIGVISIPALYFTGKRLFGSRVGLVAALLLAVSPWHIYWSQNARFYTSLMLFYSWALFAFFQGVERDRPLNFLSFVVLLYLAMSERLFALFIVPVVICYLLALKIAPFEKPAGLRARNLWLIALPGIAFIIFELYSYLTTGYSMIIYEASFFVGQMNHTPLRLLASLVYRIGVPLICLGTLGGVYLLAQRKRAAILMCSAAWVPPLALVVMSPFTFTIDRYVFVSLPFWIILSAVAVCELLVHTDKAGKILALGVLLLVVAELLSQDALYYLYQNGNRPDWRAAFALVGREMEESDLVVATRPELGRHYLSEEVGWINSVDPDTIVLAGTRVWFIIDEATGWVAPDLQGWISKNAELIDVLRVTMPGKSLSILIYLYDPTCASPPASLSNDQHRGNDSAGTRASPRPPLWDVYVTSLPPNRDSLSI